MKPAIAQQFNRQFKRTSATEDATTVGSAIEFCKTPGCDNFAISSDPKEKDTRNYYCGACRKKAVERGETGERLKFVADVPFQHADKQQRQRRIDVIFGKVR